MADIQTVTTFLGWCTLINIALLLFSTVWVTLFRNFTLRVHSALFTMDGTALEALYVTYLGNYKLLILVVNLVPYLALRIMF